MSKKAIVKISVLLNFSMEITGGMYLRFKRTGQQDRLDVDNGEEII